MNKTKIYILNIYDGDNLIYSTTICARNMDYALNLAVTELEKNFPNLATGNKVTIEEV